MLVTLAGAMSTAELGLSLAEMIRAGRVHAICATGANLEEDLFNLVAHDHYQRVSDWRGLSAAEEKDLERRGLNRVTDTCIPESEAFRAVEAPLRDLWRAADAGGERRLPHEYVYRLIRERALADRYQIDRPIPGSWRRRRPTFPCSCRVEDSTLGNVLVAEQLAGNLGRPGPVLAGTEYMTTLAEWYAHASTGRALMDLPEIDASPQPPGRPDPHAGLERTPVGFFRSGAGSRATSPSASSP